MARPGANRTTTMALSEFDLIERFFTRQRPSRADVSLGIGDDCALLQVPAGYELALTVDTLIEGRHFPVGTAPEAVGHKAMAVSLSDLAAMGATPAWATLSLSLPEADENWLSAFARGLFELADQFSVELVGGDTVRGPLCITLQLHGFVPVGAALRRRGAQVGDLIYVTGSLGDAGQGLHIIQQGLPDTTDDAAYLIQRLNTPAPRVLEGMALRRRAHAAIDISDGLMADLGHILKKSAVGAELDLEQLPISAPLKRQTPDVLQQWRLALGAGDDYELCFTVPPEQAETVEQSLAPLSSCTCVGVISAQSGLRLYHEGQAFELGQLGFDHFAQ